MNFGVESVNQSVWFSDINKGTVLAHMYNMHMGGEIPRSTMCGLCQRDKAKSRLAPRHLARAFFLVAEGLHDVRVCLILL